MTGFWILILIFSIMYPVQPGRRWVSAQSLTEPPVYQPDKELSVDIGDSATLWCCISENELGIIAWFKQPNRKKPQIIVTVYKTAGEKFYNESQKSRFQIGRSSNCFNVTILSITQSDEAMYYCALPTANFVFADGTYIKIKGDHGTVAPETSKPARCDHSVVCEPTLHGHSTNTTQNTYEKTVLGLGTALGLCVLLIFCLTYFILRRRKCEEMNASTENSSGTRQENEVGSLNYAALKFSKQKVKAEKGKTDSSDECVYSDVKKSLRCNRNDL